MRKKVSQKEIAAQLGLSQRAVSKALNGDTDISERTRELVRKKAKELRYTPNRLARSLIDGKTRIIGVVMPRAQGLYFYRLWQAIEDAIIAAGYTPLMLRGGFDTKTYDAVFQLLMQYHVEGMIVLPYYDDWRKDFFETYVADNGNVVFIGKSSVSNGCCVYNDDYEGARIGVRYLLEIGHRNIAFVGSVDQNLSSSKMRYAGYRDELKQNGNSSIEKYFINANNNKIAAGILQEKLNSSPEITALFCNNDKLALEVFHVCREIGVEVPSDLSILGYTNNFHYPDDLCMPLSTIGHNPELVAETTVNRVVAMIEGRNVELDSPIANKLIIRKSTGQPKKEMAGKI